MLAALLDKFHPCGQRLARHILTAAREIVPCVFDRHEFRAGRNEPERLAHFIQRSERIARAVNKQGGFMQILKMRRAQLLGLIRRMQRIRQQQQRVGNRRIFGYKHARLPAAVRMAAQEHANRLALGYLADGLHRAPQSRAILCAVAKRRAVRTRLAERQIAAQHHDAGICECFRYGDQQGRAAIRSRAMAEHKRVTLDRCSLRLACRQARTVQETAYRRFTGRLIDKAFH